MKNVHQSREQNEIEQPGWQCQQHPGWRVLLDGYCRPIFNFTNIYAQLLHSQIPKAQKGSQLKQLSGSVGVKAVRKHIDEIDPRKPLKF